MTKADEGVTPNSRGTAQLGTPPNTTASVGVADLTHAEVLHRLSDYLDDALGETARHRIEGHLAVCQQCAADLETLRGTVRAVGQLPAAKAPARAIRSIVEQARREASASSQDA